MTAGEDTASESGGQEQYDTVKQIYIIRAAWIWKMNCSYVDDIANAIWFTILEGLIVLQSSFSLWFQNISKDDMTK